MIVVQSIEYTFRRQMTARWEKTKREYEKKNMHTYKKFLTVIYMNVIVFFFCLFFSINVLIIYLVYIKFI